MAAPHEAVKERYRNGLWNRYFLANLTTRLAYPWTRIFIAMGLTPNQVSLLSFTISLAGMAVIAFAGPPFWHAAIGGVLLMVGLLWDHSDGQVARKTGQGSPVGGLLDTIIDRWVEGGWILALGLGVLYSGGPGASMYPAWFVMGAVAAAAFAALYFRWALIQKDIYALRGALVPAARRTPGDMVEVEAPPPGPPGKVRTFWIPFFFNRDATLWLLFLVTVTSYWVEGLLAFAAVHVARGLEVNYYTFRAIREGDDSAVSRIVHPDYHK